MGERPGVLLYFSDIRPFLKRMTQAEKGNLLDAILGYAEFGVVPCLSGVAEIAFDFLQSRIDIDAEVYEKKKLKKKFAGYSRWAQENGNEPLSFAQWKESFSKDETASLPEEAGCEKMQKRASDADECKCMQVHDVHDDAMHPMPIQSNPIQFNPIQPSTSISSISMAAQLRGESEGDRAFDLPEPYQPPSEDVFERMRQERLSLMDSIGR